MKDRKGRKLKPNESQMSDGRYRYRYTDHSGRRRSVYAYRLVASDKIIDGKRNHTPLRELEKEIEADLRDGIFTATAEMSVNEMINRYLGTKKSLANSTKENYYHMWEKNIKDFLGSMRICDVRKSDILRFYAYLYEERDFANTSIQMYQNLLYPAFELCKDDSIIRLNPCKGCMKGYKTNQFESKRTALTDKQMEDLLKFLKESTTFHYLYNYIALMLETGIRMGECNGLTYENIDFEKRLLTIDHQILYRKKDGKIRYYASPTKTKKSRVLPLSDLAYEVLMDQRNNNYLASRANDFEVDGYKHFVFLNGNFKCFTPNTLTRSFHSIRESYNQEERYRAMEEEREPELLPDFTAHTFRHSYASKMARAGINVKVLQELMGHANISVTMQIYTHFNLDDLEKEIKRIEKMGS